MKRYGTIGYPPRSKAKRETKRGRQQARLWILEQLAWMDDEIDLIDPFWFGSGLWFF